ncbi:two-component sensor histidine kinase [Paramagnetospirillum kuznetsovii]|uniref:histidine kinase n=2 Tax=Paramagnetospirillum kuznetsovii TaxID=2053833 RepID=A0A364NX23_9PROT|nr:two-component sensor histidine kinase [Paramagnetospirillum kuznetsovii]
MEQVLDRQRGAVAEQVNGIFKITETFLVAANRWVSDHPERDPRTDPDFAALVRDFQRITNESMLVRLVDEDGTLHLVPEAPGAKLANVADRDYFREAMAHPPGDIFISAPFRGRSTGLWALSVATRMSRPSHGATIAFVAIEQSLFNSAFAKGRIGEEGSISLVRRDGVLLARSATNPGELGRNLSQSPVFTEGLAKSGDGVLFTQGQLTDGVPKLIAFGALPNFPLVVTVGASMDSVVGELRATVIRVAMIMALVSVLMFLATRKILSLLDDLAASRSQLTASRDQMAAEVEERRHIEAALQRSNGDLEQFAYIASHDLQTPLRNIVRYAQLLERRYQGHLEPDAHDFIEFIVDGGKHMTQLIGDLLEYSRIASQAKPLDRCSSKDAADRAVNNLRVQIEEAGAEVVIGELPEVMADDARLVSLFQNLLGNGLKYRSPERPSKLSVTAERAARGTWRFAVADNGIGIEREYFEKIFQIFQRLNPTSETEGTGIGLTLCRRIVDRFGGAIWLESTPGSGTTFFFTLEGGYHHEGDNNA